MILAALNFDLSFFTSIPGMLITGGVLLLIIALIIFIATSGKKDKKKGKEDSIVASTPSVDANVTTSEVAPQPVVEPSVFTTPLPTNVEPSVSPVQPMAGVSEVGVVQPQPQVQTPTVPVQPAPVVMPSVVPSTPVMPEVKVDTPAVTPTVSEVEKATPVEVVSAPSVPVVEPLPVESAPSIEVVSQAAAPVQPVVPEPVKAPEAPRPIYGGTTPIIPDLHVGNEHRPIYGGANPLENTGAIPKVVPQSAASAEQPVVNPMPQVAVQPEVVVPVQPTVSVPESQQPVSAPSTPAQDEIESLF